MTVVNHEFDCGSVAPYPIMVLYFPVIGAAIANSYIYI